MTVRNSKQLDEKGEKSFLVPYSSLSVGVSFFITLCGCLRTFYLPATNFFVWIALHNVPYFTSYLHVLFFCNFTDEAFIGDRREKKSYRHRRTHSHMTQFYNDHSRIIRPVLGFHRQKINYAEKWARRSSHSSSLRSLFVNLKHLYTDGFITFSASLVFLSVGDRPA